MGIEGIAAEVQRVAQAADADGNARVLDGDYAGAKRVLTAAQKELRLLKRDALDEERKIREAFQDQRLKVSKSGQTLLNIDQAKATITAAADETKKRAAGPATNRTPTTQTVAPLPLTPAETLPPLPPQWMPDPTGRHHYRYWDGQRWTAHASTNGQTVNDPIEP